MAEITDLFNTALERDVYFKIRDDVAETYQRSLTNFITGPILPSTVCTPAIIALAWIIRAALLPVKESGNEEAYQLILKCVREVVGMADTKE